MVVVGGPASLLQIGVWPDDQESGARGAADANQEEIGIFFAVGWDSRIWLMAPSDVPLLRTASYSLKYWLIYNLGFKYEIFLVAEKLQTSFRNQVSISPEIAKQHNPPPPSVSGYPGDYYPINYLSEYISGQWWLSHMFNALLNNGQTCPLDALNPRPLLSKETIWLGNFSRVSPHPRFAIIFA